MSSLFRIDTDMLKSAFQFDTSKLNFDLSGAFDLDNGSVDLGSLIDPDDFQLDLDLTEMPDLDMSTLTDLFANMDLSVSEDKMQELAQKVLVGYKDYVIGNGILNLNKISFSQYLKSDAFKTLMNDAMGELFDQDGPAGPVLGGHADGDVHPHGKLLVADLRDAAGSAGQRDADGHDQADDPDEPEHPESDAA